MDGSGYRASLIFDEYLVLGFASLITNLPLRD
ncbi:hypothetical protein HDE79_000446 [Rhodanobacter sp. MP1X3]|nr:hypothetical protein [Rhodanobacter sp. MP1X3]